MARILTDCKFRLFSLAVLMAVSTSLCNALEGDFLIGVRPKEPTSEHLQELVKTLLAAPPSLTPVAAAPVPQKTPDGKNAPAPAPLKVVEPFQQTALAAKLAVAAQADMDAWLRLLLPPNVANAVYKADAHVRARAAWVLGLAADRRAMQPLINSVAYDPDESVREAAGFALPLLQEPVALRMLADLATAGDYTKYPWVIRRNAAEGLVRYGNPLIVERLLRALSYEMAAGNPYDPKNRVRGLSYGIGSDNPLMMPTASAPPDLRLPEEDLYPVMSTLKVVTGKNFDTLNKDIKTWFAWWKKEGRTFVLPTPGEVLKAAPVATHKPAELDAKTPADLVDIVRHLGLPALADRKAAQQEIMAHREKFMPIMLGMLHPKFDTDVFTRLGILSLMAANAPLSEEGSRMMAYVAIHDPFGEVRREAAIDIRSLDDNEAIRSLMKLAASKDPTILRALAAALREIDDKRILAAIVRAVPQPSVVANMGQPTGLDKPAHTLPIGGLNMPIYLPSQSVVGTATDIDSPAADLLKLIAQKDLGNMPSGWRNWLCEKVGDISQADRDNYRQNRSILDHMGSPPSGNTVP